MAFDKQAYMTEWRLNNPDASRRYAQNKYRRFVDILTSAKSVPCMDCGNTFPRECMDFDHVRGDKLFDLSDGYSKPWKLIEDEIAKCDVICANCHRIRTAQRATFN